MLKNRHARKKRMKIDRFCEPRLHAPSFNPAAQAKTRTPLRPSQQVSQILDNPLFTSLLKVFNGTGLTSFIAIMVPSNYLSWEIFPRP
jgi:hypothetical protein